MTDNIVSAWQSAIRRDIVAFWELLGRNGLALPLAHYQRLTLGRMFPAPRKSKGWRRHVCQQKSTGRLTVQRNKLRGDRPRFAVVDEL